MQSLWWDGPEHFFMEKPWAKMDKQQLFFWKPIHVLVLVFVLVLVLLVVVVAADSAIPIWPGKAATYEAMKRQRLFQTGGHAW